MDTLNRTVLIVLPGLVVPASLLGMLIEFGVVTPAQIQAVIPYQNLVGLFNANFVAAALVSILLLIVVFALAVLWLRGQYATAVTAIVGGYYDIPEKGPGETLVDYGVVERSIDGLIKGMPGVIDSDTQILAQEGGELIAHTTVTVRRSVNIQNLDKRIENAINRAWLDKLGLQLVRHDMTINISPVEQRVA